MLDPTQSPALFSISTGLTGITREGKKYIQVK